VLSFICRRFRARFTPGSAHPHRRICPECEAFAAAVESAAGARLPQPVPLRRRLSAIAASDATEGGTVLPFPVPRLPLPRPLAVRLRAIPAAVSRPALPAWVRTPRYAVAASTVLALLLGPFMMGATNRGVRAADAVREEVAPLLERTGENGKEAIGKLRAGTAVTCGQARQSAERSLHRLDDEVSGLSSWLSAVVTEESTNRDPRGEAGGSARRP
jgi:hypothetical protein